MLNSVDEYVAGEEYDLPDELADRFVILGYADGDLSRSYTQSEQAELQETSQTVGL